MSKLIKLTESHYIIVDDSDIKEGDWVYHCNSISIFQYDLDEIADSNYKKITHSTQPLNDKPHYAEYKIITLSQVKELIGEVDVEESAQEYAIKSHSPNREARRKGYIDGYNQALEDNKEKKYTEDDLWKAVNCAYVSDGTWQECVDFVKEQVLQPKTEWEVEIVDGKLKLK